ncbi:hypothetical protein [Yoonia sp. 2307UL14-13]|uniref:hypothetical protein n=1 Tax=Yoonia sp. 2307UL14-13 TaxID=3126506 RepID=UPI00309F12D0
MITRFTQPPKHDRWDDYFEPGEVLLWQGAPEPGIRSFWGTLFLSIFGVPFFGGGLMIAGSAFASFFQGWNLFGIAMGIFLLAFSVPFLTVGAGLVVGSWLAAIYGHRFTRYALTNKRAYIANSFYRHSLKSFQIKPDDIITLTQGNFDSVHFKTVHDRDSDGDKTTHQIGFDGIVDAREVYQMIRKIQAEQT